MINEARYLARQGTKIDHSINYLQLGVSTHDFRLVIRGQGNR